MTGGDYNTWNLMMPQEAAAAGYEVGDDVESEKPEEETFDLWISEIRSRPERSSNPLAPIGFEFEEPCTPSEPTGEIADLFKDPLETNFDMSQLPKLNVTPVEEIIPQPSFMSRAGRFVRNGLVAVALLGAAYGLGVHNQAKETARMESGYNTVVAVAKRYDEERKAVSAELENVKSWLRNTNVRTTEGNVSLLSKLGDTDNLSPEPANAISFHSPLPESLDDLYNIIREDGRFGASRSYGRKHLGLDIQQNTGTKVLPVLDGTVVHAGEYSVNIFTSGKDREVHYGNTVIVHHGDGFYSLYAHLNGIDVEVGERVIGGFTRLGGVGQTGNASVDHLHMELHADSKYDNGLESKTSHGKRSHFYPYKNHVNPIDPMLIFAGATKDRFENTE
ncbi:MAG: M23 family metallopeptidase [Candidatus Nanoarchaeia archaeon]